MLIYFNAVRKPILNFFVSLQREGRSLFYLVNDFLSQLIFFLLVFWEKGISHEMILNTYFSNRFLSMKKFFE